MSKRKSEAWNYFQKLNTNEAKCNRCGTILSCKGSSTTGLINHLKLHDLYIATKRKCNDSDSETLTSQKVKSSNSSIKCFLKSQTSLSEILAKCAAKDGFSFNAMIKSEAIRGYVTSRNYNMPRSCTSIQKHVLTFFDEKKHETKTELIRLLHSKKKFSIAVDEWTDVLMRRFLNVTLRSSNSKQFVLGLVPIKEKCTAEKTKELVENVLEEFGINLETDIVASTNDGASVMVKYCSIIAAEKQLCYNHAIHLAVLKTLYKNVNVDDVVDEDKTEYDDDEQELLYYDDEDNNQDEEPQSPDDDDGNLVMEMEENSECYLLVSDIKPALYAMRKLIKFFKNSSVRTEILLKHVRQKVGKNLKLILDVRTRWNTLASAVNRFLKLIDCVNNALDELGLQSFDENYINVLRNISITLEPTMLAVQELSKKDANLITAEGTILYVMKKLKNINTELSLNLLQVLKNEIEKRRNKDMVSLLIFLHQGTCRKPNDNEFLSYSSKSRLKNYSRDLFQRLFLKNNTNEIENREVSELDSESEAEILEDELTEYDNLQICIETLTKFKEAKCDELNIDIDTEFKRIEGNGGNRSRNMDILYDALLTVSPTSTSCERVFSVSGNTMTKIRSRLAINTLNALVFLKYYFNKN